VRNRRLLIINARLPQRRLRARARVRAKAKARIKARIIIN
jgi:hypothetical protein